MKKCYFLLITVCTFFSMSLSYAQLPEVGENDFLVSDLNGVGDASFPNFIPNVTFNSIDNEYLILWDGYTPDGSRHIFGEIRSADGTIILNDFTISNPKEDGTNFVFDDVSAFHNETNNQYIILWAVKNTGAPGVDPSNEELFCQIMEADGTVIKDDFRISEGGVNGTPGQIKRDPSTAFNPITRQYLVAWYGNDPDFLGTENKLIGQFLDLAGNKVGAKFRIDNRPRMVPMSQETNVIDVELEYNPTTNQFFVVWQGSLDSNNPPFKEEIYGQILNADGSVARSDFQISDVGDSSESQDPSSPAMAYNPTTNQYLVVWAANDPDFGIVFDGVEVYGRLLNADGNAAGPEFQISNLGGNDNTTDNPDVAYNSTINQFLVIWEAVDPNFAGIVEREREIYGRFLLPSATPVGSTVRLSDAGGTGNANSFTGPTPPQVVANSLLGQFLVIWNAIDFDVPGLVSGEREIFGQFLGELAVIDRDPDSEPIPVMPLAWTLLLVFVISMFSFFLLRRM